MTGRLLRPSLVAYNGYDSGLGNRVRVVLGAKSLAELEDREFYYVWPTGKLFGPTFDDLWKFDGRTVSRSTSRLLAKFYPYVDESLTWLDDAKRNERVWQIRTGSPIVLPDAARPWTDEFRNLMPAPQIADRVNRVFDAELRGQPYVGVMIRAHAVSHAKTREVSPVQWFVERMEKVREQHPDVRFFVSCDVEDVQREIVRTFGRSVALEDKGAYNSIDGIRSGVCDLYLLGSSSYLIGPHWSSFIHLARHLAAEQVSMETAVVPNHGEVDIRSAGLVDDPLRPSVRHPAGVRPPV